MEPQRFTNPSTDTTYRLVFEPAEAWRITKSRQQPDRLALAHLRGRIGTGDLDGQAIAALVAGTSHRAAHPCDPEQAFRAVVRYDLDQTANLLTAIAREATSAYDDGRPGFRPRSPFLREQRDAAMAHVIAQMRAMGAAYLATGWGTERVPAWLSAAMTEPSSDEQPWPIRPG